MDAHSAGYYLLEALTDLGIKHLFGNLGTDHVSIIEELAIREEAGLPVPRMLLCPHENTAVHMAAGYALATGLGQAVIVHVDAGTANAAMAMHNLFRSRIPVLLLAGRAPYTVRGDVRGSRDSYVHFVQDPFDIRSLVRPYVKWEYDLPSGLLAKDAVRRAQTIMQSDPMGPAYMTFARETLAETFAEDRYDIFRHQRRPALKASGLDHASAERIADEIMAAESPLAISAYLGRSPEACSALETLSWECAIRVVEFNPTHLSIPRNSPCFSGFDPVAAMENADLGLLLDVDVPFVPKFADRAEAVRWLQIDVDPLKRDLAMWEFSADFAVQADCARALHQILDVVRSKADDGFLARVAKRRLRLEADAKQRIQGLEAVAAQPGELDAISPNYVCAALARKLSDADILVNEAICNANVVLDHVPRSIPGTYFADGGGGLGFSGGVALGLKLAMPNRRIVQIVGDGVFHFCNPDAIYAVAQQYNLPIFTVILDNGGWRAVKESVRRVYPHGEAVRTDRFQARLSGTLNGEVRRFDKLAEAFGAHGEHVRDPLDLESAIVRCLAAVDSGQAAVLHVQIEPF